MLALSRRVRKEIRIGPRRVTAPPAGARNRIKNRKLFSIILDPALNQEVHLFPFLNIKNSYNFNEKRTIHIYKVNGLAKFL